MIPKQGIDSLRMAVERLFPANHIMFLTDPEDEGVVYVRVYGIPDAEVRDARGRLWDAIDGLEGEVDTNPFIPSIVSLSDTAAFYPEFLPDPPEEMSVVTAGVLGALRHSFAAPGRVRIPAAVADIGVAYDGGFEHGREIHYAA